MTIADSVYEAAATAVVEDYAEDADDDLKTIAINIYKNWLNAGIRDYARGRLAPVNGLHKSGVAGMLYRSYRPGLA